MAEIFPINESVNGSYNLFLYGDYCCPDIWTSLILKIAATLILLGLFLLLLYLAETRRDIGYAVLMALTSIFAFNDTILAGISYPSVAGVYIPTLPFMMLLLAGYEVMMTLLLVNEMRNRELLGGDRDHGRGGGGNDGE
jgi:hypothetical protein